MYFLPVLALIFPSLTTSTVSQLSSRTVAQAENENRYKSVAYFANWATYERNFHPQDLRTDHLTHVIYAFANIYPETGEIYLSDTWSDTERQYPTDSASNGIGLNVYGCAKQLYLQKKRNRRLKTLLSVGGWTYSANFAQPASTIAGRARFASSAVQLVRDLGFDGLDIDWEFPQDESEADDLVSLIAETRKQMDRYSEQHLATDERLLLTVASSAGPANYHKLKLAAMDEHLDFWNLMTYDYSGSQVASHNANWHHSSSNPSSTPFNSSQAIIDYTTAGIPASKMIIGMPLYGRSFANTSGPGKPFSGIDEGTWGDGVYDYKDLPLPGAIISVDYAITAAWSYDSVQRIMISFDTPQVVSEKTKLIKAQDLGGVMWWEASSDKKDEDSLIAAFVKSVGGFEALEQSQNLLNYPVSLYNNIKTGMPYE